MRLEILYEDGQGQGSVLDELVEKLKDVDLSALEERAKECAFDPMWIVFVIQLLMWLRQLRNPDAPPVPMPPFPPIPMESTNSA